MSNEGTGAEGRGSLIVVSAPSGAGKSTLVQRVLAAVDRLRYSVSYTTRARRGSEQEGVEYHFVSEAEFMDLRERGQFLEWAQVHGSLYGTRRDETERLLDEGFDLILDIDVQGAAQVKRNMPEAVTVFILPPSRQVLESRLRSRNLNEPLDLRRRLVNAAREVRFYEEFDYLIVNDDLERAAAVLGAIILADRHRSKRQRARGQAIIDTFGGELLHA